MATVTKGASRDTSCDHRATTSWLSSDSEVSPAQGRHARAAEIDVAAWGVRHGRGQRTIRRKMR